MVQLFAISQTERVCFNYCLVRRNRHTASSRYSTCMNTCIIIMYKRNKINSFYSRGIQSQGSLFANSDGLGLIGAQNKLSACVDREVIECVADENKHAATVRTHVLSVFRTHILGCLAREDTTRWWPAARRGTTKKKTSGSSSWRITAVDRDLKPHDTVMFNLINHCTNHYKRNVSSHNLEEPLSLYL